MATDVVLTPVFRLDGWISTTVGGVVSGPTPVIKLQDVSFTIVFLDRSFTPGLNQALYVVLYSSSLTGVKTALVPL